jgi:hypothetical protein
MLNKKRTSGYYNTLEDIMRCYTLCDFGYFDEEDQEQLAQAYLEHDNLADKEAALEILQEIASDNAIEYVGLLAQGKTTETGEYLLQKFTKCQWLRDKVNYDMNMINLRPDHQDQPEE